jgi:hypothetical protein
MTREELQTSLQNVEAKLNEQLQSEIHGQPNEAQARAIRDDLKEALPADGRLTCGTTLCRLETRHAGTIAYRQFQKKMFVGFDAAWQGSFTITRLPPVTKDAQAPVQSVVFLGNITTKRRAIPVPVIDDCPLCGKAESAPAGAPH